MATESDVAGENCILSKCNGYDQKSKFDSLLRSSNSISYRYTVQHNWENFLNADPPVCSSSQRQVERRFHIKLTDAHLQSLQNQCAIEDSSSNAENYIEAYLDTPDFKLLRMGMFLIRKIDVQTKQSSFCLKVETIMSQEDDYVMMFKVLDNEEAILAHMNRHMDLKLKNVMDIGYVQYVTMMVHRRYFEANNSIWVDFSNWSFHGKSGAYGVITCSVTKDLTAKDLRQLLPDCEPAPSKFLAVLSSSPETNRACDEAMKHLSKDTQQFAKKFFASGGFVYPLNSSPYEKFMPVYTCGWDSGNESDNCETASDDEDKWGPDEC